MARARLPSRVPRNLPFAAQSDIRRLADLLAGPGTGGSVTCISGAGVSTASGLPDYRSPGVPTRRRRPPITYQEYIGSQDIRNRYWARSFVGFPVTRCTLPNAGHRALAALHNYDPCFTGHIAQNVDGLFQKAGIFDKGFIELHGTVHAVECLECRGVEDRDGLQIRLEAYNPGWTDSLVIGEYRADGDADLDDEVVSAFRVPPCVHCGNHAIIPKFVFMGGTVPKQTAEAARRMVDRSRAVLICGSTVTTYSSYSLVLRAKDAGSKVAIVNYGETRADKLADLKIEANISDTLCRVARERLPCQSFDTDPEPTFADGNIGEK